MNQLAPYHQGLVLANRYARYSPRLRTARVAGQAARFAYENRTQAAAAARSIKRAYLRYKRRNQPRRHPREQIGDPVGTAPAQRQNVGALDAASISTETLYSQDVTDIAGTASGTAAAEIDQRRRALVNLRGLKLCMEWENTTTRDLLVNIAIISPRHDQNISSTDFFRGNGDQRGVNFDSSALNSLDLHCRPINTDKYHVLGHERFALSNDASASYGKYKFWQRYVTINRQMRYLSENGGSPTNPVFLVYWCARSNFVPATAADSTGATISFDAVAYFKSPCIC